MITTIALLSFVFVLGILLRSWYERHHLTVANYSIETDKLGKEWNGYTFAVLADLHDNEFGQENKDLMAQIKMACPDAILIAGDMMVVKEWKKKNLKVTRTLIKQLASQYPVFYGNGNHEQRMRENSEAYPGWYEEFQQILKENRVHYLSDDTITLEKGGTKLTISGLDIDRKYYEKGKKVEMEPGLVTRKLGRPDPSIFHVLLAHTPLYLEEYEQWGADLVLSGHFHGGTIRLPIMGGVMSPQCQFFTARDRGLIRFNRTRMIVSGGLGTHSINIRLNNYPQLVVVRLKCVEPEIEK
ncbi:MAG: metallophosphoesterase [Lachnospiraceae bacterium]